MSSGKLYTFVFWLLLYEVYLPGGVTLARSPTAPPFAYYIQYQYFSFDTLKSLVFCYT